MTEACVCGGGGGQLPSSTVEGEGSRLWPFTLTTVMSSSSDNFPNGWTPLNVICKCSETKQTLEAHKPLEPKESEHRLYIGVHKHKDVYVAE